MSIYDVKLVNKKTGVIDVYNIHALANDIHVCDLLDNYVLREQLAQRVANRDSDFYYSTYDFEIVL